MYQNIILIITVVLTGFVAGSFSRAMLPGDRKRGFVFTSLLGVVGCFIGDKVAQQYFMTSPLFAKGIVFEAGFEYMLYLTAAAVVGAAVLFVWDRLF
jgi:uncharacterized membrane protein YeaQ/YmgE (transglycosylase-associated protein family)